MWAYSPQNSENGNFGYRFTPNEKFWGSTEKVEYGCTTTNLLLCDDTIIVLKITLLHSISVITNFVIPKRDKNRQITSHFFVYCRRTTHDPHHTWHGDRGGQCHCKCYGESEYSGNKVLQPWRGSGGNWNLWVTLAYLSYWWDFCRAMLYISAAYAVMRCPSVRLSICPSVFLSRSWILSKRINISFIFLLSGLAILVFPQQTLWQYSDGPTSPPNGGVECNVM